MNKVVYKVAECLPIAYIINANHAFIVRCPEHFQSIGVPVQAESFPEV